MQGLGGLSILINPLGIDVSVWNRLGMQDSHRNQMVVVKCEFIPGEQGKCVYNLSKNNKLGESCLDIPFQHK